MKVLIFNEFTSVPGGIDSIVNMEIRGLRNRSINVLLYRYLNKSFNNQALFRRIYQYSFSCTNFLYNRSLQNLIYRYKPDIIHFHNIYQLFRSPIWNYIDFYSARVVLHMHNFYPFCLNSFCYRRGGNCQDCVNRNSWIPGIKNGCYNHSVSYSYLTAIKRLKPFRWIDALNKVSKVISVSQFLADKLFEFGVPANKVIVLPNAVETGFASGKGKYVLYLGNIIYEKGVELVCLIAAKLPYIKFVIAGEGADKKYLISKYSELKNLEFRGYLTGPAKENILQHAYFLYYPSLCQETFGLSILEAYSHGKPVLTTGFGSTGNLVIDNKTGIINKNTSLESQASSINTLWQQLKAGNSYKENCLEFVKEYACEKHLDKLIQCYTEIL